MDVSHRGFFVFGKTKKASRHNLLAFSPSVF